MSNRYFDIDMVSRVSTGKAASEGYRRECRARILRGIGYVLVIAIALVLAFAFDPAKAVTASAEKTATALAPVCADYGTGYYSCDGY